MSVITISRGSYSRGVEIAEMVAERLGYRCLARDVLIEASKEFNIPEVKLTQALEDTPSFFERFTQEKKKRLAYTEVSGSKSVAGKRIDCFGTWENLAISECYFSSRRD